MFTIQYVHMDWLHKRFVKCKCVLAYGFSNAHASDILCPCCVLVRMVHLTMYNALHFMTKFYIGCGLHMQSSSFILGWDGNGR